jgi:hypothetical protein
MSQHIKVCDDKWHARAGEAFTWQNKNDRPCDIQPIHGKDWPFANASYHVPASGTWPGKLKDHLPNGTYTYNSDCCPDTLPKNVIVP